MEIFEVALKYGIGGLVIVLVVKYMLPHLLSRELEAFKAIVKQTADVELEGLRDQLRRRSFEHEKRFSFLHEERAKAVLEIHRRAVHARSWLETFGSPIQVGDYRRHFDPTVVAVREFLDQVDESIILFEGPFAEKLRELRSLVFTIWQDLWIAETVHADTDEGRDLRWKAGKETTDRLVPMVSAAQDLFRTALRGEIDGATESGSEPRNFKP